MNPLALACFLLILTTTSGCGNGGTHPAKSKLNTPTRLIFAEEAAKDAAWPDAQLRQAFYMFWNAALEGQFEDAYRQEAGYVRQLVPKEKFVKVMEFMTDPKKVNAFEVGAPRARSPYLYEIPMKLQMPNPVQGLPPPVRLDYWVKTDTGWHHAIKASLLFPELGFGPEVSGRPRHILHGKEVDKEG